MRRLSLLIIISLLTLQLFSQTSPHGETFKVSCTDCHNTESWKIEFKTIAFNHGSTNFPLVGQHQAVNCRLCHKSLDFSRAGKECVSCHTDLHNQTVGPDCGRCHTPNSWIVNNITELHQKSRFPLVGPHVTADCYDCHVNASPSLLNFGPLGVECIDCHQDDYSATTNPDHEAGGFSTNCIECHTMTAFSWTGAGFNHSFFPLTAGHDIDECSRCHTGGSYANTSPECITCHESNYNSASNPNHVSLNFSTSCQECHTTNPGWTPAEYRDHDARFFPIYSGAHNGTWSICTECHTNPAIYAQFSCIDCHDHNQPDMNDEHGEVSGYAYNSIACYGCHPTGSAEGSFNHNASGFPLTGAHTTVECSQCHVTGFTGTSTVCYDCHTPEYNQSTNPNHNAINIPKECATCHTTMPDWKPATFPIHDNYFILQGAHVPIANDCFSCHKGDYNNTSNICYGCHAAQYNQTTNPNHITSQFPTTCETCHSQTAWSPSTFDHSTVYPLTGAHAAIANNCFTCHEGNYINTPNTCAGCHLDDYNQTTNPNHTTSQFPTTCETCHSTNGWSPSTFDHGTVYPLTGAHAAIAGNCFICHQGNYTNTPNTCDGCHMTNYNQSTNPNHVAINIPTVCATCHTTNPGWAPATFPIHNNYYVLAGAHVAIANECAVCHNGNYNSTPNTCVGCHLNDYNQTTNPNHAAAQFPTTCTDCHSQNAWIPANWDHDGQYFPIYSGKHQGEWNSCSDCHKNPNNYSEFTCTTSCHPESSTNDDHQGVAGYSYNSAACYNCHPNGTAPKMMERNINKNN